MKRQSHSKVDHHAAKRSKYGEVDHGSRPSEPGDACGGTTREFFVTHVEAPPLDYENECLITEIMARGLATGDGQFHMSSGDLAIVRRDGGTLKCQLLRRLQEAVFRGDVCFPFKRSFTTPSMMEQMFSNLVAYMPAPKATRFDVRGVHSKLHLNYHHTRWQYPTSNQKLPYDQAHVALVSSYQDYVSMDGLSDYFQERARLSSRTRKQSDSPLDAWNHVDGYAANMYARAIGCECESISPSLMREILYKHGFDECSQFKPTLAKSIILMLGGERILDFCAGWGDRLLGAASVPSCAEYLGFDPNTNLKDGYDEIIVATNKLRGDASSGWAPFVARIIYEAFETATVVDGYFNLVLTSPPYFDFEHYSRNVGQSTLKYPRFEDWMACFLLKSIFKAWGALANAGHMAIHLMDTFNSRYCCEIMNLFIGAFCCHAMYCGVIGSSGVTRPGIIRPTWVWLKDEHVVEAHNGVATAGEYTFLQRRARSDFERWYPSLFARLDECIFREPAAQPQQ
jgi:hypothetical protein